MNAKTHRFETIIRKSGFDIDFFKNVSSILATNDLNLSPFLMADTTPPSSNEASSEEFLPLGSKESRAREAEKIRQDFVKSTRHLPRPVKNPEAKESGQDEH